MVVSAEYRGRRGKVEDNVWSGGGKMECYGLREGFGQRSEAVGRAGVL